MPISSTLPFLPFYMATPLKSLHLLTLASLRRLSLNQISTCSKIPSNSLSSIFIRAPNGCSTAFLQSFNPLHSAKLPSYRLPSSLTRVGGFQSHTFNFANHRLRHLSGVLVGCVLRRVAVNNVVGETPFSYTNFPRSFATLPADATNTTQQASNSIANHFTDIPSGSTGEVQGGDDRWHDTAEHLHNALSSVIEAAVAVGSWSLHQAQELMATFEEFWDLSSYTTEIATQAGFTTAAAVLAWFVMPKFFHILHNYVEQGLTSRLLKRTAQEKVPYELSFWSALEDPAKFLVTIIAFSLLGSLVAPKTIATLYISQISRAAAVISIIWFLHRWKSNAFSRVFAGRALEGSEKERFLALDKISSVGLLVLGGMAIAETLGVAMQSFITVGGIGGVATAFAARDVLGNMLSGFALQFAKPFSIGDTISAGSVEGQVLEIGLTSTHLLNSEKFPVVVPNSFFSNQVIVNKSRAQWRLLSLKLPVLLKDYEKIPQITRNIQDMLTGHPAVHLDKEAPRCVISRISLTSFELTVSCPIKPLGEEEILSTEQEIILETVRIVSQSGATVGASSV